MTWFLSLFAGRSWQTYAMIGLGIALAVAIGIAWWKDGQVSARDQKIGALNVQIEGLVETIGQERIDRLKDRAFAALNSKAQAEAITQLEKQVSQRRVIERKIYVDRPIPVDVEAACRPVLDALNADLGSLRDILAGGGAAAGQAGRH